MDNSHEEPLVALLIDEEDVVDVVIEEKFQEVVVDIEIEEPSLLENDENVVVETFEQRRIQKFRAENKSKKQWILTTIGIVIGIIVLVILALESPLYDVDAVTIKNPSSVQFSPTELTQITTLSKKLKHQSMYRVDADSTLKKIRALPFVSSVKMKKIWRSDIELDVTRRVPVAYVETNKGIVVIDSFGIAFEKVATAPNDLPSFEGIGEMTFNEKISNTRYLSILDAAPKEISTQIAHVIRADGSYDVILSDGIDVKLGHPTDLKQKLAIAWSILLTKKRSQLGFIDVSVPSLPVSGSPQLKV
jgi:cell division protein FtsQ